MKKQFLKFIAPVMIAASLSLVTVSCETDSTTGKDDVGGIDKDVLKGDDDSFKLRRGTPAGGGSEGSIRKKRDTTERDTTRFD